MTKHIHLRSLAEVSGRELQEVYRLFRLPGAPAPIARPGGLPAYDLDEGLAYLASTPPRRRKHRAPNPPDAV